MEGFKLFGGKKIDDIRQYVSEFLVKHPEVGVFIGTDSQTHRRHIEFASVVCFQFPNKGVHVVFRRERIKKKSFRENIDPNAVWKGIFYQRLWREVELSLDLAQYIRDYVDGRELIVDLDFNGDTKHESNRLYDAGKGYVTSMGFQCRLKPDAWAATYAADLVVK